jgi:hypothetical protein
MNLHAVLRWEWRAGSTIYLVWTQQRSASAGYASSDIGSLRTAFGGTADNAVAFKCTYWLGR